MLRTCPGTPSQRRAGDPLFSGKAWPTENVTLIGRRSPLRTETRQRLRRAESYRHVASYAESRLREGNPNSIRLGFEHPPRFAGFVCPHPALSALCNPEKSGRRAETYKPYATQKRAQATGAIPCEGRLKVLYFRDILRGSYRVIFRVRGSMP